LDLSALGLQAGALKALAACPAVANLRHLALSWNVGPGDQDLEALARSPYLTNLLSLELILGDAAAGGLQALFGSPNVRNLLVLSLAERTVEAPGVADTFFSSPLPAQLLRLHLFPSGERPVPGRYREALGDRLVVSTEMS